MRSLVMVSLVSAFPFVGCPQFPGGRACTTLFAYGVSATVTDAVTGAAIDNATLTLTEGTYTEVMQLINVASLAEGPFEYHPLTGKVLNSDKANELLHRPYREGWTL